MFKEILVFMLICLRFSNGSWSSWGSGAIGKVNGSEAIGTVFDTIAKENEGTSCRKNATEFLEHTYSVAGDIVVNTVQVAYARICILSNYQPKEIKEHPAKYTEDQHWN